MNGKGQCLVVCVNGSMVCSLDQCCVVKVNAEW